MFKGLIKKIVRAQMVELLTDRKKNLLEALKDEVREHCRTMIHDMFSATWDTEALPPHWNTTRAIGKTLTVKAAAAACESFDAKYKEKAQEFIEGEAFIDSVVARIMAKQIGTS
jgi:hypothetical protein